jgi:6-phosphofructokinase 1
MASSNRSGGTHSTSALFGIVTATTTIVVSLTAFVTYQLTLYNEEEKQKLVRFRTYEREQLLKKKIADSRARDAAGIGVPQSGIKMDDIAIKDVYLWECEDLRKRFPSAKQIENVMQFRTKIDDGTTIARSPLLSSSSSSDLHLMDGNKSNVHPTKYNKLITDHECVVSDIVRKPNQTTSAVAYMRAGPRRYIHFDPKTVNAAIVTCGGLCPGLNNVIREITNVLHQIYGIGGKVYGIQGGYRGFYDFDALPPVILTPSMVENIHHSGGTCLGSSRGGFDLEKILKFLKDKSINQLFVIGGDGTHRGAFVIHEGCMKAGMNVSVAGIPKTIDNDVDYIDYSFGFNSAVEAAIQSIRVAKTEAVCNLPNGIGIVKLMGRSAGFIAAHATMASSDVDLCLVPEVPVVLEGPTGCLPHLRQRVKEQGYAVVVVAEGAGEEVLGTSVETDASGNKKLPAIGLFMKDAIEKYFIKFNEIATVKYIDPSYSVRSVPANASDSIYCMQLGQNVVHGAMAGYTGFSVGLCNNRMCLIPIPELVSTSPRSMNPRGRTWERVLALTRQPNTVV